MTPSRKTANIVFWSIFILSIGIFYGLEYFGPRIVAWLFEKQAWSWLNFCSRAHENQSLGFYQGRLEDFWWGPIKSVVAGMMLLWFALKYLRQSRMIVFSSAIFLYILATRFDVLFKPPFCDSLVGPFSEAVWLLHHGLDYIGLYHQESFGTGGPLIYPGSVYSFILATLMNVMPIKAFLVVIHLLTFAAGAIIVGMFREIMRRVYNDDWGVLGGVLLVSFPLYQAMVELINMEIPSLFFAITSIYFLMNKKIVRATLMAAGSVLMKLPGIIACVTVFLYCVFSLFDKTNRQKGKHILCGLFIFLVALIEMVLRVKMIRNPTTVNNHIQLFGGIQYFVRHLTFWLFCASCGFLLLQWIWQTIKKNPQSNEMSKDQKIIIVLMFTMAVLWFGVYGNFSDFLSRYLLLGLPFIAFCFIFTGVSLFKNKETIRAAFIVSTFVLLMCSHGLYYTMREKKREPDCPKIERSLEYRQFLQIQQDLACEVEKNYSDYTIGVPPDTVYAMAFPEFGYVHKKLDVLLYGLKAGYGLKQFVGLSALDLRKTIWIGFPHHRIIEEIPYPIDPEDIILKEFEIGDRKVFLFQGGIGIEKMRIIASLFKGSTRLP